MNCCLVPAVWSGPLFGLNSRKYVLVSYNQMIKMTVNQTTGLITVKRTFSTLIQTTISLFVAQSQLYLFYVYSHDGPALLSEKQIRHNFAWRANLHVKSRVKPILLI